MYTTSKITKFILKTYVIFSKYHMFEMEWFDECRSIRPLQICAAPFGGLIGIFNKFITIDIFKQKVTILKV